MTLPTRMALGMACGTPSSPPVSRPPWRRRETGGNEGVPQAIPRAILVGNVIETVPCTTHTSPPGRHHARVPRARDRIDTGAAGGARRGARSQSESSRKYLPIPPQIIHSFIMTPPPPPPPSPPSQSLRYTPIYYAIAVATAIHYCRHYHRHYYCRHRDYCHRHCACHAHACTCYFVHRCSKRRRTSNS